MAHAAPIIDASARCEPPLCNSDGFEGDPGFQKKRVELLDRLDAIAVSRSGKDVPASK